MADTEGAILSLPAPGWLVAVGACVLFLLGMLRWRSMLLPFFVILYVEGFFRNLLDTPAVLLVKDVLLAGIYAGFLLYALQHRRWLALPRSLGLPLVCFFALAVFQMFNPALGSLAVGLVGLKTYFYYLPLCIIAPALFNTRQRLYRTLTCLLLIAVPISAYGIVQYAQGPEAYASLGPAFRRAMFVIIDEYYQGTVLFRPSATFSWPSHYSTFLGFSVMLVMGAMHLRRAPHLRRIAWLVLPVLTVAVIASGQRSLYLLLPATIMLMLMLVRAAGALLRLGAGLVAVGLGIAFFAPPAILGRFASFFAESQGGLISSRFHAAWNNLARAVLTSPLGQGTGISALGSRYVSLDAFIFTESLFARIVNELGILGLVTFFWLYLALLSYSWHVLRQIRDRDLRHLAAMVFAYLAGSFLGIYGSNSLDVAVSAVSFWLMLGIARTVSALDREASATESARIAQRTGTIRRIPVPVSLGHLGPGRLPMR
jgi:hypothetical protein